MNAIASASKLSKTYRAWTWPFASVEAVRDVSFAVHPGEIVGILGKAGSGKSTVVKLMLNLIRRSSGSISVFGCDPALCHWPSRIGYVPEQFRIHTRATVHDCLLHAGRLSGCHGPVLRRQAEECMERLQLGRYAGIPALRLREEQASLLGIALGVVHGPELVFLDEPTEHLDLAGRSAVRALLAVLRSQGTTIVLTSRSLSEIETSVDRMALMHQGRMTALTPVADLLPSDAAFAVEVPRNPLLTPGWTFTWHGGAWRSIVIGKFQLHLLMKALGFRGFTAPTITPVRVCFEDLWNADPARNAWLGPAETRDVVSRQSLIPCPHEAP